VGWKSGIELVVRDVRLTGGMPHFIPEGCLKLALPGFLSSTETEAALTIVGKLMK